MKYVDSFLLAVPTANKDEYIAMAEKIAPIYKRHGALSIYECWGDDIAEGKLNSMHTAVMRKPDENIVFSWVTWPNKEVRDKAHTKISDDMHAEFENVPVPFDGARMIFGGFEVIIER
ncbi:MAG: DUF1428 domain-containing protein [Emcibacteraceae bacterium]|nr:DUF1428 domain-containing protein [Emcibacteraceae bacterium]